MTDKLKNIISSQRIVNIFHEYDWVINKDSKSKYYSYLVGDIADYYLDIYKDKEKVFFEFTIDIDFPTSNIFELLILINFANKNTDEGCFFYDFKVRKIKYKFFKSYSSIIKERNLLDYLKIKLNLISYLFHNFVSGVHNLIYGEKIEEASLELLFLNNEGFA